MDICGVKCCHSGSGIENKKLTGRSVLWGWRAGFFLCSTTVFLQDFRLITCTFLYLFITTLERYMKKLCHLFYLCLLVGFHKRGSLSWGSLSRLGRKVKISLSSSKKWQITHKGARICVKVPLYHLMATTTVLTKSGTQVAQLWEDSENTVLDPSPSSESLSQWLFLCHMSTPLRIQTRLEKACETPSVPPSFGIYQESLSATGAKQGGREKVGFCCLKAQI